MQLNDLTGRKFGMLTVLERGENYVSPSGKSIRVRWVCQCECGKTVLVHSNTLTHGKIQSCGCVKNKKSSERLAKATYRHRPERKYHPGDVVGTYTVIEYIDNRKLLCRCNQCNSVLDVCISNITRSRMCRNCRTKYNSKPKTDLVGQKFGRLKVLRYIVSDDKRMAWECLCDCGNIVVVATSHLKSGHTKSCGCYMAEQTSKANSLDISGERFGRLTTIRKVKGIKNADGRTMYSYLCKCDCGSEVIVLTSNLTNGNTQSCGCIGRSVGEAQVKELLISKGVNYTQQHTFSDLRSISGGGLLRFDFALWNPDGSLNCLIEFNGEQHYYQDKKYKYFGRLQREETDELKREYCRSNNLKLFEIRFDDDIPARVNDIINTIHN